MTLVLQHVDYPWVIWSNASVDFLADIFLKIFSFEDTALARSYFSNIYPLFLWAVSFGWLLKPHHLKLPRLKNIIILLSINIFLSSVGSLFSYYSYIDFTPVMVGFDRSYFPSSYYYYSFFIFVSIIAPFYEETIFRGFILERVLKIMPFHLAVFLTSLSFGMIHLSAGLSIEVFTNCIITSLVYFVITVVFIRMKFTILDMWFMHGISNAMILIYRASPEDTFFNRQDIIIPSFRILFVLGFILALLWVWNQLKPFTTAILLKTIPTKPKL